MDSKHLIAATTLALAATSPGAETQTSTGFSPEMHKLERMLGHWRGPVELEEPGKPALKLQMRMDCVAVSDKAGVMCQGSASNQEMQLAEADLFGYKQADQHYHWFAVTSSGDVHDHIGAFLDDDTFHAHLYWTQDKMAMKEDISLIWAGRRHMTFESTTSADGNQVAVFRGNLKK
jgi:hypothetical protein